MTTQSSPLKILDLPTELLIRIHICCDIEDLVRLRQCCKYLEGISRERIIWILYIQKLTSQMRLYLPSFPFEDMSWTQLELTATAHLRLQQDLLYNRETSLKSSRTPMIIVESHRILCISLAPGGRYLATLSQTQIKLWDIHTPFTEYTKPVLIAQIDHALSHDNPPWMEIELNPQRTRFLIRIESYGISKNGTLCTVFDIDPLEKTPTFQKLGHLNTMLFTADANYFDPFNMIIAFSTPTGDEIWVWDVSTNNLACWPDDGELKSTVFVCDNKIICINGNRKGAVIWSLPKVPHPAPSAEYTAIDSPFLRAISWESEIPGDVLHLNGSSYATYWNDHSPLDHSFRFDLVVRHLDKTVTMLNLLFSPCLDTESGLSTFEVSVLHKGSFDDFLKGKYYSDHDFATIYFPNQNRVAWGHNGAIVYMDLSSLGNTGEHISRSHSQIVHHIGDVRTLEWAKIQLDPAIGRICVGSGNEVRIHSLVGPSEGELDVQDLCLQALFPIDS